MNPLGLCEGMGRVWDFISLQADKLACTASWMLAENTGLRSQRHRTLLLTVKALSKAPSWLVPMPFDSHGRLQRAHDGCLYTQGSSVREEHCMVVIVPYNLMFCLFYPVLSGVGANLQLRLLMTSPSLCKFHELLL